MFNFMKKGEEKTKRKRKEVRIKLDKEKLPSGITADYSAEFFAHLNNRDSEETDNIKAGLSQSDYAETSTSAIQVKFNENK